MVCFILAFSIDMIMLITDMYWVKGSHWSQITFDEKGWGASLRGLVKWNAQQSIRYNGRTLDQNTPNGIATTSDQTYVFAVCLNHTLKVWNLATNKLVGSKDLLDRQEQQQQDSAAYFLNPSDSAFVRVFNAERALDGGYRYYVATYSPHEDGRFKFWAVKGGLTTPLTIEDLFPQADLRPCDPDPSGNMFWNVADFQVKSMEEGKRMELWVLWRNNNLYQLYSLHFSFQSLPEDWSTNWTSIALDTRRYDPPPALVTSDNVDPTEKWLKYLFHPGRFSLEALETALVTYQEALKPRSSAHTLKKSVPLQERLCSTIAATVSLRKYSETDLDFIRYRTDTDVKWRQFWQIAEDINNRRFEPISLAYDSYSDLPWVLLTDSCVLVRECSATELLLHNSAAVLRADVAKIGDRWRHRNLETELGDRYDQASYLIEVAAGFRKRLSAEVHRSCQTAVDAEIFLEPSLSAPDRLAAFQERSELGERVSDDIYDSLCATMNEQLNIYKLPSELFYAIIDTIPLWFPGKDSDLQLTAFGLRATLNGSQETILHTRQMLYDLLILVVFIAGEISQEDGSTFDAVDLFSTLIETIREYEMLYWLSSTARASPNREPHDAGDSPVSKFKTQHLKTKGTGVVSTILEDLFAVHIKPRPAVGVPQSYTLTQGIRDVLSWVTRQGEVAFPNVLVFIQCDLIANGNIDLASDFLRFQPSTAWATYAKGRLYVAKSEFDTAALYFQKAAHLLCEFSFFV
jgi:nuclear pore complex protein Nup160